MAGKNRRQLLSWARSQRRAVLSSEQRAALDGALPGWDRPTADLWTQRLDAVVSFAAEHGRLPEMWENSPEGLRIGEWIQMQWLDSPRRAVLDAALPGWYQILGERRRRVLIPSPPHT